MKEIKFLSDPEKVKLFQIGALATNKLEPEGSKLWLHLPGVEFWLASAPILLELLKLLTFIELNLIIEKM